MECNGNVPDKALSSSVEDLSDYTDADESISAPTEILAEASTKARLPSKQLLCQVVSIQWYRILLIVLVICLMLIVHL